MYIHRDNTKHVSRADLTGQRVSRHLFMDSIVWRLKLSPQIVREGGWSFILKASYVSLSFLTTVMLTRILGPNGYGVYVYAYALMTLLAVFTQMGLPNLIVRETAQGMARNRPDLVRGVWLWSGRVVGIVSIAAMLLAGSMLLLWRGGTSNTDKMTLVWALPLVPLIALGDICGAALKGLMRVVIGQLPELMIRPILFLLLLIGVGILTGQHLSPANAMTLYVTAALIAFLSGVWILWRAMPLSIQMARPVFDGRVWLVSSLMFTLVTGFSMINNQASTLVLGLFEPADRIGIYRVAVQVANIASIGLEIVNIMVAPHFADLYVKGEMLRLQRITIFSARIVLGINLILTMLFLLTGKDFFRLVFGLEFVASYSPLVILLIGQLVNSATGSVGYLLNMTGQERETARGMIAALGSNVMLNLALVPRWGIQGAATASTISTIIWNMLLWQAVRKRLNVNSLAFVPVKRLIP